MKITRFFFSLAGLAGLLISTHASAVTKTPSYCSWTVASVQRIDMGPSNILTQVVTDVCKIGNTVAATRSRTSGLIQNCSVTASSGYTNEGSCQSPNILKYKVCPIKVDGCSTDIGKSGVDAAWIFPEMSFFNGVFNHACNLHDTCYGTLNNTKASCDSNFKSDMRSACSNKFNYKWYDPRYGAGQIAKRHCNDAAEAYYQYIRVADDPLTSYNNYQTTALACD